MIIDLKNKEVLKRKVVNKTSNTLDKTHQTPRAQQPATPSPQTGNGVQTFLCIITLGVLLSAALVYMPMWDSAWQLPKSMIVLIGTVVLLILSSALWIFGFIRHQVHITLLDIAIGILGILIGIISFLNPNEIAFWGSTARLFDAGVFFVAITILYMVIKVFIEPRYILRIVWIYAITIVGGSLMSLMSIYIPSLQKSIPFLNELTSSFSLLTDSPQELLLLNLIATHILFIAMYRSMQGGKYQYILRIAYSISVLIQVLLIIRLPVLSLQLFTLITLIAQMSIIVGTTYKTLNNKNLPAIVSMRISFVYTLLILGIIFCVVVRPFKNNEQFPEYSVLAYPSPSVSFDIVRECIQSGALFGSGSVLYVWNKFAPESINSTDLWSFSFETLSSEVFNIVARYGLLITILVVLIGLWLTLSVLRTLIIKKQLLGEQYLICLMGIATLILPLGVVGKLLWILILLLWSYTISQYFHPLISFSLHLRKVPSHIASVSTFLLLALIGGGVFVSAQIINIFHSQVYVVEAQSQKDDIKKSELLLQAQQKSPLSIDYVQVRVLQNITMVNNTAITLSARQSREESISDDERKSLVQRIDETQKLIDQYQKSFPDDMRLVQWQLDLYSITHRYDTIEEQVYMDVLQRGVDLRPQYLYWDLYKAQYYIRQSQKSEELDVNKLNQARELLEKLIIRRPDFVEAYQTYYDLNGLEEKYADQIRILEKYTTFVSSNKIIADRNLVYSLGLAYQNNQQYQDAILIYTRLIEAFPTYVDVYFRLGEVYEAQNFIPQAIAQYKKVLELDPEAQAAQDKLDNLE